MMAPTDAPAKPAAERNDTAGSYTTLNVAIMLQKKTIASSLSDGLGSWGGANVMSDNNHAILQHELEIAVADREHQIPAHRPEDHLGSKLPPLERLTLHHRRPSAHQASLHCAVSLAISKTLQQSLIVSVLSAIGGLRPKRFGPGNGRRLSCRIG